MDTTRASPTTWKRWWSRSRKAPRRLWSPTATASPRSTCHRCTSCPNGGRQKSMPYVVHFDEYTPELRLSVGGKNASLGEMTGAGLAVPPGFAVTTEAFTAHLAESALAREVKE